MLIYLCKLETILELLNYLSSFLVTSTLYSVTLMSSVMSTFESYI